MLHKKANSGLPVALTIASVAGIITTVMIALVTAILISLEMLEPGAEKIAAMLALLLGGAVAALIAMGRIGEKRIWMCFAGTGVYFAALLCIAAIGFDGVKSGVGVSALLVFGGGLAVALLGFRSGKRTKYRMPKMKNL